MKTEVNGKRKSEALTIEQKTENTNKPDSILASSLPETVLNNLDEYEIDTSDEEVFFIISLIQSIQQAQHFFSFRTRETRLEMCP